MGLETKDFTLADTPILRALIRHVEKSRIPLHVPGHKQGRLLPGELSAWFGACAKLDLTELPGLDNLHYPEECIAESQALAARYYGSDACFYSVNGSSAGVVASIVGVVPPGGRILFLGPFHLSAWHALILADAVPEFFSTEFLHDRGVFSPPSLTALENRLAHESDHISAVFITSPSYQGVVSPISRIAEVVHRYGLPLIVDEAHGAHLGAAPSLPPHSVSEGADVVIHSVHKMLPALTQTAWVHVRKARVSLGQIAAAMRMMQTTSPSYLLLASIDAAQAWLRHSGRERIEESLVHLNALHEGETLAHIEPFRHFLFTGSQDASDAFQRRLGEHGIFPEYADALGVLSVFGLELDLKTFEEYLACYTSWQNERLSERLSEHEDGDREVPENQVASLVISRAGAREVELVMTPRESFYAEKRSVPIRESLGQIAAEMITPYPPGVPLIWPGQRIRETAVEMLEWLRTQKTPVNGISQDGTIMVCERSRHHVFVHHI